MDNNFKMVAKTLFGFEELLAKELRNLGAQEVKIGVRNVSFVGDKGFMYKANLALRTAIKILKPIKTFRVANEQDLYNNIYKMPWDDYMSENGSLAINATVHSDKFTHSQYIALKTKDAIVDKFRDTKGTRPNVDLRFPDLKINIHIDRQTCTVSLDSSGESLHRRGYKTATNIAPINEVLAAGLVMLSGWDGQSDFMDPMCKTRKAGDLPLHMVFNPPYGERLESLNVEEFYGDIGTTLKHGYPGTNAWLITSNLEGLKHVGLRPSRKIKLFNAKLEARLVKYEMYEGSKKAKKQE